MKKLTLTLAAFGCLAGTASAATWTATEVQAEAWARAHVVYVDQDEYEEHLNDVERARYSVEMYCNRVPVPADLCADAQKWYEAYKTEPSSRWRLRPYRVDCRGASPSRDAYHFSRFRCRAQFKIGWGNILVTITGKNRAVWRWIP